MNKISSFLNCTEFLLPIDYRHHCFVLKLRRMYCNEEGQVVQHLDKFNLFRFHVLVEPE